MEYHGYFGGVINMDDQLCSSCKTGAEFVKLDPSEPLCYHIDLLKDGKCSMYIPITPSLADKADDKN